MRYTKAGLLIAAVAALVVGCQSNSNNEFVPTAHRSTEVHRSMAAGDHLGWSLFGDEQTTQTAATDNDMN